ncbi:MAG: ParB/RepB/Spo0J family partition protein [Methylococcaceae bacterium]|nr:ParB/RepB/Spo0J family partition protein [Methylococcaceae bacterium]
MTMKKRGLGRGLDALLGDVPVAEKSTNTSTQQTLPIELLQRGKYQPRKDMNAEKLQDLANSIAMQGIVQPIVVRHISPEQYEIVAGERRWRAAQLANLQDVPVIIKEMDDRTAMAIALIENIQREDLNVLEEAEALQRLLIEFEMTHQQVADAVGKSRTTVTNLLRLLELVPEVKKMLINKQLEMGHARALLPLTPEQQVIAARKITNEGMSVRLAEKLVKDIQQPPKVQAKNTRIDTDVLLLQNDLSAKFSVKVQVERNENGKGKLIIHYSTFDELEGILSKMP